MTSETEGAKIYYTNDGSTPTEQSILYTEPIPFVKNDTIYAIAVAEGMGSSSVTTFTKRDLKVATPVATISDDMMMTITCEENAPETFPETKIYYQKNKKSNNYEGFSNWILYEGPVQLTEPGHVRTTALRDGWINSEWGQYNFYNGYIFDKPVFEENQEKKVVVLKHSDPDAKIYYTLDGTKPTKASTLYEDTIHLEHNSVVTAVAAKDRYFNTDTIRREYKWFTAKQPEVTISKNIATITCEEPAEAEIYYTLDNSNPSRESKKYDGPIVLASNCNIKAFAVAENWNDAPVTSYRYRVVEHTCKKPAFSRYAKDEEGNLHMTEDSLFITTETEDAIIYYTLNGDKPTERSLRYEGFIKLTGNCTVKAIAVRADLLDSEEAELAIDWFKVETPQIAFEGKLCTITSDSEGATIYYTLDESEPTTHSTFYKGRFALPNQQVIVKAMAVKEDWHDSEIRTRTYNPGGNTCEAPVIARVVGTDSIQMSTRTENTTIYYTLNGLNPTVSDSVYTKPFCLPHNGTLKAMATNPIYYDSEVTSFNVNWYKAAQPVITVEDKVVTMTCATEGAEIHYTLDGSDPTEENAVYRDRITMTGTCTVKAIATYENYNTSTIAKLEYRTSDHACSVPEFTRQGDSISIAATPVENTTIYYTTDGTEPTTSSEIYTKPIKVQENCTIKAIASNPRLFQSEQGSYDVNWFKVDEPVISFDGIYATITCAMPNSKIHYTLDGTTPTDESPLYTGQLTMSSSCNIKAIAMREHFNNSSVVTMAFDKNQNMVGKPQFQRTDSTITISATPLEGTIIYYTTDGTEPTVTSEVFRDTIRLNGNCVIKAMATNPKYFQSEIGTLDVNWFKVEMPEITFDGIMAVMNCATPKARIYYTLDGSAPTEESLKYTGAVAMTASCTVKAIAMRSDYNNSAIVSMAFSRDDNTVGKPMFQRTDSTLAISATPAEGTIIYYTTDGTEPNTTSKVYTERIRFESNCTVRAMATNPKMFTSPEASYDVDWFNVETPEITFDGIMAAVNCGTPNARIYYTLDGTVPTEESLRYNGNIQMTATCTVKAVGVRSGYNNSAVASVAFNKEENTVTKPIFHKTDSTLRITATPAEGTVIYYTTDGTQPNSASTVYADSVRLEGNCTVKAVAMNPKMFDSETADYEVNWFKVEAPEIAFDGIFATIRCATPAARIYYTTDGSTPTEESTKYSGTLTMTASCTVKAVAVKEKYNSSAIVAMAFSRDDNTVGKPLFQRTDSTLAISATPAEGTIIYYTTDGTEPNTTSKVYTERIRFESNCTVRAMATNPKMFTSPEASYDVDWFNVETPEITFDGIMAAVNCGTPNARIYYTLDGTVPTEESLRYNGNIQMTATCTVKAVGVRSGYNNSAVASVAFNKEENTVTKPIFHKTDSTLRITATPAEGTVIYYTTDGTQPNSASTVYADSVRLEGNCTVKAVAMNPKMFDSETADYEVNWFKVEAPEIAFDGIFATIRCATPAARIYYTTDGSTPTEESTKYSGTLTMTASCTVKAVAVKEKYNSSAIVAMAFSRDDNTVGKPLFQRTDSTLAISATPAEGTIIYYTTDGTEPNTTSKVYTERIRFESNCTVRAMATNPKMFTSPEASYDVDWFNVETPEITFDGIMAAVNCGTPNARIYYTLDGTVPTEESLRYNGNIQMTATCTVKAVGVRSGYNNSAVASVAFNKEENTVTKPIFHKTDSTLRITATPAEGTVIYYTTDGTQPNSASTVYADSVRLEGNCTVKAVAMNPKMFDSETADYEVNWFKVEAPEIAFDGIFATIRCTTPAARIYYTTDGSTPTEESTKYSGTLTMTTSCTVKAVAMKEKYNSSAIVAMAFSRDDNTVGKPMFQRTDSTLAISATPAEGTIIYYTTDGTEPNTTSKVYTERIRFESNCTVRAMATNPKMFTSPEASYDVDWFNVETPEITFDGIMAAVNCGTPNARIYYTLDGTVPTEESLRYNGNIQMTATCTVKAVGVRSGYNNSAVASVAFNKEENTVTKPIFHKTDSTLRITATPAEGTVIYYTTDGTQPNSASTVYADSVRLEGNCTVKAVAMNPKMFDSETADYEVNWFKVEAPEIAFDGIFATIRCTTPAARIYYTTDGSTPTEESTKYSGTLTMTASCTVKAVAVKEKYNSSAIVAMAFSRDDNTVGKPMFQRTDSTLAISATPAEGTIIYYTTDGTEPTVASATYTEPLKLNGNCTIKAMAENPKLFQSETADYNVGWFKVETPEILFDGIIANISCATPNARIFYTTDGTTPTEESPRYMGQLTMSQTCTLKALAVKEDYHNSTVSTMLFDREANTVSTPSIRRNGSQLSISTETVAEGTVIYYTTDGTDPTTESTRYTTEITVDENMTVKALAMNEKLFTSGIATFDVDWFKVATPVLTIDGTTVTANCNTANATLYYAFEEDPTELSKLYTGPIELTDNREVRVIAMRKNYHNSEMASFTPTNFVCQDVTFSYNGRYLQMQAGEGQLIYYTLDGSSPTSEAEIYSDPVDIDMTCTVKAMATRDYWRNSSITAYDVTFVYNGEDVIMEEAGHLEELLNGTGGAQNIESLPVKGKMDSKDLLFIKSMPNLRHLDLTEAVFEGNVLPDEAFAGMSIISFQSPTKITSAGKNLFKGCDQLAAVVWNANVSVPESMVEDVKQNPNFLLYVNSRVYAPSSYKGNLISGGQATSVTLYDTESGGNFCCPQRFYTQQISYTHNYSQQTEKGATRGWETLALPFDVGTITHEKRGSLAPFAKGEDITQYKPFWLYELKETGFTRTSDIKAYTPYIISMPNNPDYADDYILSGKVTFAAKNIYVEADTTHISMKGSVQFAPAMQRQPKGNSVLVINLEDYTAEDETFYPNGSAFLPDLREVHPFESFALTGASARPILLNDYLWEETSDIEQLEMGMLKEIGKNRGVFDLSGRRIVNESMQKNRKQHQRVYIINGKKTLTK
ncbi:chitobiase/beta-hexosaminidase C-terminal domain-containing protein [Prevotella sp. E13-27]|uniref:chitobiase/beta-hexosaminidase C-terminal domain-containing protein n=1 Tax=Prevotella sp. E13-27 TaxID=2938122 RepID=UPI00200ADF79|nr:chitobiase/beta-hexosaminidase C-terminal domain-containing protein [Prevotella sp. E13-27]MCK8621996.1 chitobiase/beta-hexosaminidase C-terminal domain-containing protein [Prevotella sp. E13-27]